MDKRNLKWTIWIFLPMVLLMAMLIFSMAMRRTPHIILPDTSAGTSSVPGMSSPGNDALKLLEVKPETVQAVIATLSRPTQYRRTVTVEQFWAGGSGSYDAEVSVSGAWTRIDRTMSEGQIRHTITGEEETFVWYNDEDRVYEAPAGGISADNEQFIPTYEEILDLPQREIAAADYQALSGVNCVYVETGEDAQGYVTRYWVSVETGLLVSAEKLQNGETVYRMTALTLEQEEPAAEDFVLPTGRSLTEE